MPDVKIDSACRPHFTKGSNDAEQRGLAQSMTVSVLASSILSRNAPFAGASQLRIKWHFDPATAKRERREKRPLGGRPPPAPPRAGRQEFAP